MDWVIDNLLVPFLVTVVGGIVILLWQARKKRRPKENHESPPRGDVETLPRPSRPGHEVVSNKMAQFTAALNKEQVDQLMAFQESPRLDKELTLKIKKLTIQRGSETEAYEDIVSVFRKARPEPSYYEVQLDGVRVISSPIKMSVVERTSIEDTISNADQLAPFVWKITLSSIARITLTAVTDQTFAVTDLLEWAALLEGLSTAKVLTLVDTADDSKRMDFMLASAFNPDALREAALVIKPHLELYRIVRDLQDGCLKGIRRFPVLFSEQDFRVLQKLNEIQKTGRLRIPSGRISVSLTLLPEWRSLSGVRKLLHDSALSLRNETYRDEEVFLGKHIVSYYGIELLVQKAKLSNGLRAAAAILLRRRSEHSLSFYPRDEYVHVRYIKIAVK